MANREQESRGAEAHRSKRPEKVFIKMIGDLASSPTRVVIGNDGSSDLAFVDASNFDHSCEPLVNIADIESSSGNGTLAVFSIQPGFMDYASKKNRQNGDGVEVTKRVARNAGREGVPQVPAQSVWYTVRLAGGAFFTETDESVTAALVFEESIRKPGKGMSSNGPVILLCEGYGLGSLDEEQTLLRLDQLTIEKAKCSVTRNNDHIPGRTVWKENAQQVVDRLMHALPPNVIPPGGF